MAFDELKTFLRVNQEPGEYLGEQAIHEALTADPAGYLAFVEERMSRIATGRAMVALPSKQIFEGGGRREGDFRVMPCVVRDGTEVTKTVKIVGTNIRQETVPGQITVGKAFRLHPVENFITHSFEGCLFSSARTGLCVALALRHLAPTRATVTIIGAGRVGYYTALYVAALGGVETIRCCDVVVGRASWLARLLDERRAPTVTAGELDDPSWGDADVLVLATTATEPVLSRDQTRAALVVSVGADTSFQRELDLGWAADVDLYVDSIDGLAVGDLAAWSALGLVERAQLVELLDLVRWGPRPARDRTRLFISTGSALLDNLTIQYLLERRSASTA